MESSKFFLKQNSFAFICTWTMKYRMIMMYELIKSIRSIKPEMEELLFTSIIQKLKNFSAILSKCDWLATAEVKSIWVQEADEGIESETILQWDDLRRLSKLSIDVREMILDAAAIAKEITQYLK